MTTNASSAVTTGDRSTENDAKKMDPALKAKWVEALRSGKYQQARSYLRDYHTLPASFCCLGVLADLQGAEWREAAPLINNSCVVHPEGGWLKESHAGGLPLAYQKFLADMNDGRGRKCPADFSEIADYIEANL